MNILKIKGVGEKTAALFSKLNITDTGELIRYLPRDYDFFEPVIGISELTEGVHAVRASCKGGAALRYIKGKSIITANLRDATGSISVVYFNMPYVRKALSSGAEYVFRGNAVKRGNTYVLQQPRMYKPEEYDKLSGTWQPVYSTTKGLSSGTIQKAVKNCIKAELSTGADAEENLLYDRLPDELIEKRELLTYSDALLQMHAPENMDSLINARRRMAYQEFFDFIYSAELKRNKEVRRNNYPMIEVAQTGRLIEALPYRLTPGQEKTWDTIREDMCSEHGLHRLVQGDVGSGKTIIAFLSLLMTAANGFQGALMAPTDVLARQHFEALKELISRYSLELSPVLLTGGVKGEARKKALADIASGEANVVIGTHALFQEGVKYSKLALVITDEQHRFGVIQRENLKEKGTEPHVMIMSATPIPRTLAMILYGDMDVSVIRTMPVGRLPIKNCVVDTSFRSKAYDFVVGEVKKGNQVYIICPQVESGELPGVENAVEYEKTLRDTLPDTIRTACLHGKMKPSKKDEIMDRMSRGEIDVLVSTTVVEVGVNVPGATLMYVENAERFGLAQLHQLRGRVGRSDKQSYCIFMMGIASEKAKERLGILERSNDGFEIADMDMKLRGPGDIFGIRQSGEMNFMAGDIYQDGDLIKAAAEDVRLIIREHIEYTPYIISDVYTS